MQKNGNHIVVADDEQYSKIKENFDKWYGFHEFELSESQSIH